MWEALVQYHKSRVFFVCSIAALLLKYELVSIGWCVLGFGLFCLSHVCLSALFFLLHHNCLFFFVFFSFCLCLSFLFFFCSRWLVHGAKAGDSLFMHYSGHGGSVKDHAGDEEDGKDETMIPVDYATKGQIKDDEILETVSAPWFGLCWFSLVRVGVLL